MNLMCNLPDWYSNMLLIEQRTLLAHEKKSLFRRTTEDRAPPLATSNEPAATPPPVRMCLLQELDGVCEPAAAHPSDPARNTTFRRSHYARS